MNPARGGDTKALDGAPDSSRDAAAAAVPLDGVARCSLYKLQPTAAQNQSERRRFFADAVAFTATAVIVGVACWAAGEFQLERGSKHSAALMHYAVGALSLVLLVIAQVYRAPVTRGSLSDLARVVKCVTVATLVVLGLWPFLEPDLPASASMWSLWLTLVLGIFGARLLAAAIYRDPGRIGRPTLVIGGSALTKRLAQSAAAGVAPVSRLSPPDTATSDMSETTDDAWWRAVEGTLSSTQASQVIIETAALPIGVTKRLVRRCADLGLHVALVPAIRTGVNRRMWVEHAAGVPLLHLAPVKTLGVQFAVKHAYERVLAVIALVVLSPLFAVIAIAIKSTSRGPVFFKQVRVGQDGREFELFKFRSMREPLEKIHFVPGPGLAPGGIEGEDRTTAIGRLLRRTSLDELPQLINVARGEMSLVGPRPERPEFVRLFRDEFPHYDDRHRVKAGLTGWAQVHGLRGQTSLAERLEYDNYYIENWSHSLDLKIMLLTIPALLKGAPERAIHQTGESTP